MFLSFLVFFFRVCLVLSGWPTSFSGFDFCRRLLGLLTFRWIFFIFFVFIIFVFIFFIFFISVFFGRPMSLIVFVSFNIFLNLFLRSQSSLRKQFLYHLRSIGWVFKATHHFLKAKRNHRLLPASRSYLFNW